MVDGGKEQSCNGIGGQEGSRGVFFPYCQIENGDRIGDRPPIPP
jgi:hypothetical protein